MPPQPQQELFQKRDLDFQDAIKAHIGGLKPQSAEGGVPFIVLPDGYGVQSLETLIPDRKLRALRGDIPQGRVTLTDVPSFLAYVQKFKGEGTALFADRSSSQVTAHLDYHSDAANPGERQHQAVLKLALSRQWKTWMGVNRKRQEQSAFGEFVEDSLPDVLEPDAARLLEAARNLVLTKEATFESRAKVADGSIRLCWEENVSQGKRDGGSIDVPERLKIAIPLFENGAPIEIEVRLRFKLDEGKVYFTLIIDQAEAALEAAFAEILQQIEKGTGFKPYLGSA